VLRLMVRPVLDMGGGAGSVSFRGTRRSRGIPRIAAASEPPLDWTSSG
jgi:hypothetical protein